MTNSKALWTAIILVAFLTATVRGQGRDSTSLPAAGVRPAVPDRFFLLLYARLITEPDGNYRVDENVVANFRLNRWLRMEAGFRQGQRPQQLDAYYHYKLELQTRWFWNSLRIIARVSDNVIKYPSPVYARSNYLAIAETRYPLSPHFLLLAGGGYVFTFQQDGSQEGMPSFEGTQNFYGTYKFILRYRMKKGFVDAVYGTYDVFNPYLLTAPFVQIAFEYDLTERTTLYSYARYQFNKDLTVRLNEFLGLGVRLHILKG